MVITTILYSLGAFLIFGIIGGEVQGFRGKITDAQLNFYRGIFAGIVSFIAIFVFGEKFEFNWPAIAGSLVFITLGYIGLLAYLKALYKGKAGVVTSISSTRLIFSMIFGFLFFGEEFTILKLVLGFLVLVGIILMSIDFEDFSKNGFKGIGKEVLLAQVTALTWGISFPFFGYYSVILGFFIFNTLLEIFNTVFAYIQCRVEDSNFVPKLEHMGPKVILYGVLTGIAGVFQNLAFSTEYISIASAITGAAAIVSLIWGAVFYKEKLTKIQYIAFAIILVSVVSLAYFI